MAAIGVAMIAGRTSRADLLLNTTGALQSDYPLRFSESDGKYKGFLKGAAESPRHTAVAPDGTIYVASYQSFEGMIEIFDAASGACLGPLPSNGLVAMPEGITVGNDGSIYVSSAVVYGGPSPINDL